MRTKLPCETENMQSIRHDVRSHEDKDEIYEGVKGVTSPKNGVSLWLQVLTQTIQQDVRGREDKDWIMKVTGLFINNS